MARKYAIVRSNVDEIENMRKVPSILEKKLPAAMKNNTIAQRLSRLFEYLAIVDHLTHRDYIWNDSDCGRSLGLAIGNGNSMNVALYAKNGRKLAEFSRTVHGLDSKPWMLNIDTHCDRDLQAQMLFVLDKIANPIMGYWKEPMVDYWNVRDAYLKMPMLDSYQFCSKVDRNNQYFAAFDSRSLHCLNISKRERKRIDNRLVDHQPAYYDNVDGQRRHFHELETRYAAEKRDEVFDYQTTVYNLQHPRWQDLYRHLLKTEVDITRNRCNQASWEFIDPVSHKNTVKISARLPFAIQMDIMRYYFEPHQPGYREIKVFDIQNLERDEDYHDTAQLKKSWLKIIKYVKRHHLYLI